MGLAAFNSYYQNLDNEPDKTDITGAELSGYALMDIEALRELALSLGIPVHWKAGKDKIIAQIEEYDNEQVEVDDETPTVDKNEDLEGGEFNGQDATQEDSGQGDDAPITD